MANSGLGAVLLDLPTHLPITISCSGATMSVGHTQFLSLYQINEMHCSVLHRMPLQPTSGSSSIFSSASSTSSSWRRSARAGAAANSFPRSDRYSPAPR